MRRGTLVVVPRFGRTAAIVGGAVCGVVGVEAGLADVCEPCWAQAATAISAHAKSWLRHSLTVRTLEGVETLYNGSRCL